MHVDDEADVWVTINDDKTGESVSEWLSPEVPPHSLAMLRLRTDIPYGTRSVDRTADPYKTLSSGALFKTSPNAIFANSTPLNPPPSP